MNKGIKMNEIQFLIYHEGQAEVLVQDETLWAPQKSIAELFGVTVPAINQHLKNIFESGELEQNRTIKKILIVRQEGSRQVTREIEHYNLDAIISVGYRVNSQKATKFRIWATGILKRLYPPISIMWNVCWKTNIYRACRILPKALMIS